MSYLLVLVPIAILMGLVGLMAFLWSLRNGQYDDLDGAAERVLIDEDDWETEPASPAHVPVVDRRGEKT